MLSLKTLILLLISIHCLIDIASTGKIAEKLKARIAEKKASKGNSTAEQKVSKAPKLTPDQVEFSKKFYKNLMDDQKKGEQGIPLNYSKPLKIEKGTKIENTGELQVIGDDEVDKMADKTSSKSTKDNSEVMHAPQNQPAPGGIGTYRSVPSGGAMFMDGLCSNFLPIGDPYGGLPDGIISMAKWCIEIIIKGALFLIYSTIRWPHKILLKLMIIVGAITWLPTTIIWCLNPVSISRVVGKSKIANNNFEELAAMQYKLKVRLANVIDKVHSLDEVQKLSCCMYMDWRDTSVAAVDEDAKEFLMNWFHSFVKLHQIVYCGDYIDGTGKCKTVTFDESEPLRVIPRSHVTLWVELFVKFF